MKHGLQYYRSISVRAVLMVTFVCACVAVFHSIKLFPVVE